MAQDIKLRSAQPAASVSFVASPALLFATQLSSTKAYVSADAAGTWTPMPPLPAGIDFLHACAAQSRVVYGAGASGVFRSADAGSSWVQVRGPTGASAEAASAVEVDPADPNIALVSFIRSGIFRTVDGGQSWVDVTPPAGFKQVTAVAVSPADPATAFANAGGSIWRTHDRGTSWVQTVDAPTAVENFGISAADPQLIYAGTFTTGLWRTSTAGD